MSGYTGQPSNNQGKTGQGGGSNQGAYGGNYQGGGGEGSSGSTGGYYQPDYSWPADAMPSSNAPSNPQGRGQAAASTAGAGATQYTSSQYGNNNQGQMPPPTWTSRPKPNPASNPSTPHTTASSRTAISPTSWPGGGNTPCIEFAPDATPEQVQELAERFHAELNKLERKYKRTRQWPKIFCTSCKAAGKYDCENSGFADLPCKRCAVEEGLPYCKSYEVVMALDQDTSWRRKPEYGDKRPYIKRMREHIDRRNLTQQYKEAEKKKREEVERQRMLYGDPPKGKGKGKGKSSTQVYSDQNDTADEETPSKRHRKNPH